MFFSLENSSSKFGVNVPLASFDSISAKLQNLPSSISEGRILIGPSGTITEGPG